MRWSDLGKILKPIAPILAAAIPGGGVVTSIVAEALGADETPDAIAEAIKTNPEAAANLLKVQNEHEAVLKQMALQLQLAELQDIANARAHDVAVRSTGARTADVLGYLSVVLVGILGGFLMWKTASGQDIPPVLSTTIGMLIGGVLATMNSVYQFWFGSSKGSRDKDEMVAGKQ